jgi:homoserine kinase
VRVPCSTSNLGAGFDTIGLALDRYVEAAFAPGGRSLEVERTGTLEALHEAPEEDYLVVVFQRLLGRADVVPAGRLHIHSDIPVARGLGSSAAARVAGHDLARGALGQPLNQESAFRYACSYETHGDNAAPCALGGLRAVVPGPEGMRPLLLQLSEDVGFAYAAPAAMVSTAAARAALPLQLSHQVAVAQLGRLAALIRGLADGDPALLQIGTQDELHVPHRLPLIPGGYNAMGAGHDAGAWAVTISGSGSGLIALCPPELADPVADAMRQVFDSGADDPDCVGFPLHPDFEGLARPGA